MAAAPVKHFRVSYNDIHNLIRKATPTIAKEFNPDLLVAIGIGFFPARVMRTFLRELTDNKSLTIQAIGLSLYEPAPGMSEEQIGNEVVRTQWLSDAGKKLVGKRVLVVDEVDDTRKTLSYALSELQKDIDAELATRSPEEAAKLRAETKLSIFVVHNKDKPKLAQLPEGTPYWAGETLGDLWLDYPWEQTDIEEHDKAAAADKKALKQ
ncbi:PRTase-like protein [Cylindrobasidium torrendii FP15055 ss-10]|uniref:PRTase-like protein n=1 Tax=Cylindrobasidium torrendii FP15055 ss-10 TaxID=1314674 RepID=A0A0D7BJB3_9AGAR|nr:PRTase-like protein [Cylindrobasidium torrendii FP15055 ss-10]